MSDIYLPQFLRQIAVYWAPEAADEFGQPGYADPIEVKCRWSDVNQQYLSINGDEAVSNAMVLVDRDLKLKGILWLGVIADLTDENNPNANEGSHEIQKFNKVPDVSGKKFVRTAVL